MMRAIIPPATLPPASESSVVVTGSETSVTVTVIPVSCVIVSATSVANVGDVTTVSTDVGLSVCTSTSS